MLNYLYHKIEMTRPCSPWTTLGISKKTRSCNRRVCHHDATRLINEGTVENYSDKYSNVVPWQLLDDSTECQGNWSTAAHEALLPADLMYRLLNSNASYHSAVSHLDSSARRFSWQ